ncbi:1-carboxy-3-chloro-3,4-dihydroxycyclo hexa-1,5-diene dehydrogenase [Spirochaetia bacterium]|nr:1-carboxy-3-chloro-3,4-dihydroxycyclo hexa-1,5-diene dehydrogenase [Spirochaetia bacterium]
MNTIGFGLVGFGIIGRTHLTAMQANLVLHDGSVNALPRALCTRRPEACAGLPFEKVYSSLKELVEDSQVQVLDVCTPNNLHGEAVRAGLAAGKGVYAEKPLSHDQAEADQLAALAGQARLPNQCALTMRFRPMVNRMKDLLEAGAIGEVIHFRVSHFHDSYLNPDKPMNWRQELGASGGGAVMDLGIHILDLTRYLLGDVGRLRGISRILNKTRPVEGKADAHVSNKTDEYLQADLEMKNGAAGILECSRISSSVLGNSLFEVFGSRGSLLLHGERFSQLTLTEAGGRGPQLISGAKPGKREAEVRLLLPESRQSVGTFVDGHAAAIKNMANWAAGLAPFSGTPTFAESANSQALVHACLRSAEVDSRWETL